MITVRGCTCLGGIGVYLSLRQGCWSLQTSPCLSGIFWGIRYRSKHISWSCLPKTDKCLTIFFRAFRLPVAARNWFYTFLAMMCRFIFSNRTIYLLSAAVVLQRWSRPRCLLHIPVLWNAIQSRKTTFCGLSNYLATSFICHPSLGQ